jgi:hypothetical protein
MIRYRCRWLVSMNSAPIEDGAFVVAGNRFIDAGPAKEVLSRHAGEYEDLGDVIVLPGLITRTVTWITVHCAVACYLPGIFLNGSAGSTR